MRVVGFEMGVAAVWEERIEVGARMRAWMNITVDDAQAAFRGGFLFEQGAVDDVTHAVLLGRLMRRGSAAERFQADCRHTCAIRYWPADAAVSRRRRPTASGGQLKQTRKSCRRRSWRRLPPPPSPRAGL